MNHKSHAVIGTDTTRDYAFTSVFCALFWRDLVGIDPVVLMVGSWTEARDKIVKDALGSLGI